MSSKVQIANLALQQLGMNPISALTDNQNPTVRAINHAFDPTRDALFGEHRWPFATTIGVLAELTTTEVENDGGFLVEGFLSTPFLSVGRTPDPDSLVAGWLYVYAYPSKAATVWAVFNEATAEEKDTQEFDTVFLPGPNKRAIVSNLEEAYCEYTYKVQDTSIWSSTFIVAFSFRLAAMMAHTLLGDVQKGLKLMEISNAYVNEAKRVSWSEKVKKPSQVSGYQNCR